jgi:hypothetical protein
MNPKCKLLDFDENLPEPIEEEDSFSDWDDED